MFLLSLTFGVSLNKYRTSFSWPDSLRTNPYQLKEGLSSCGSCSSRMLKFSLFAEFMVCLGLVPVTYGGSTYFGCPLFKLTCLNVQDFHLYLFLQKWISHPSNSPINFSLISMPVPYCQLQSGAEFVLRLWLNLHVFSVIYAPRVPHEESHFYFVHKY